MAKRRSEKRHAYPAKGWQPMSEPPDNTRRVTLGELEDPKAPCTGGIFMAQGRYANKRWIMAGTGDMLLYLNKRTRWHDLPAPPRPAKRRART